MKISSTSLPVGIRFFACFIRMAARVAPDIATLTAPSDVQPVNLARIVSKSVTAPLAVVMRLQEDVLKVARRDGSARIVNDLAIRDFGARNVDSSAEDVSTRNPVTEKVYTGFLFFKLLSTYRWRMRSL